MRRTRTFFYCLKLGVRSIFHNGLFSLASIGITAASLFLLGLFFFVTANVKYVMGEAEKNVGVTVFFQEDISEREIKDIGDQIKKRVEVSQVEYISADQAWETYKKEHLSEELAATFGEDNPLEDSASYKVYLSDVSMQQVLVRYIEALPGVRKVNALVGVADSLSGINRIVTLISVVIILILVAVAIFLIRTTVTMGISVRKDEIFIMNIIGATDFFIRFPFIVEGMLLGMIGAMLPIALLYVIYEQVILFLSEKFDSVFRSIQFLSEHEVFQYLLPLMLAIGILIGLIGSSSASKKQLKKIRLR